MKMTMDAKTGLMVVQVMLNKSRIYSTEVRDRIIDHFFIHY